MRTSTLRCRGSGTNTSSNVSAPPSRSNRHAFMAFLFFHNAAMPPAAADALSRKLYHAAETR